MQLLFQKNYSRNLLKKIITIIVFLFLCYCGVVSSVADCNSTHASSCSQRPIVISLTCLWPTVILHIHHRVICDRL